MAAAAGDTLRALYFVLRRVLRQPVYILRRCEISLSSRVESGCVLSDSKVGKYSYIAGGVYLTSTSVGNYCSIASGAKIGGMEHSLWWGSTSARIKSEAADVRRTTISDDVWIGSNAVVRRGVRVGRGAVIGAGAVVLADVPDYTIVVGVPAKVLRKRFSDSTIEDIAATRFWERDPVEAKRLLSGISYPGAAPSDQRYSGD